MKKILLDTNLLMAISQFKVDIFSELERLYGLYEAYVLDGTIEELKNIEKTQKGKHKEAAKIARNIIEQKAVNILKTETLKNVDDLIVELAKTGDFVIATQDRALKKKLKVYKAPLIALRQKKYLKEI